MGEQARSAQKRVKILNVAAELFLARGYSGVSVDDVVERAGGSKTSIYGYFGGKDGLFAAVMERLCKEVVAPLGKQDFAGLPLRDAFVRLGNVFLAMLLAPRTIEVHRLAVAEAHRHPEAAHAFLASAPETAYAAAARLVAERQASGDLQPGEPRRLAAIFLNSLTGEAQLRMLLEPHVRYNSKASRNLIETAVDIFLDGLRSRSGRSPQKSERR